MNRRRKKSDNETSNVEESASFDQMAAEQVVKLASESKAYVTITRVDNISEQINPPLGLNTVALLAAGSKAMGMSPKKVMQVAEKLYSGGFISYPRTETTRYDPKGFDVRRMLREHTSHPEWGRTASHLLRTKYANTGRPPLRGHDAGDHPPITCLKAATRDEIGGGAEWRVYEFVARNFLGSLSDELKVYSTCCAHSSWTPTRNKSLRLKRYMLILSVSQVPVLGFFEILVPNKRGTEREE